MAKLFNNMNTREKSRTFVNKNKIINPHYTYIEPDQEDIDSAMKEMSEILNKKLKYSRATLRDLANYFSYPERPSEFNNIDFSKLDVDDETRAKIEGYYEERRKMFELVGQRQWSGYTPLQQAIHAYTVYKEEIDKEKSKNGNPNNQQPQDSDGDPTGEPGQDDFDCFIPGAGPLAGDIKENMFTKYKEIELAEKIKQNPEPLLEVIGMGSKFPEIDILTAERNKELKLILDNLSKINVMSELQVDEFITNEEDLDGPDYYIRQMNDFNEITALDPQSIGDVDFLERLLELDYDLTIPVRPNKAKQVLVILIDRSGSMHCLEKQAWVKAILFNRMEAVIKGYAKLFVATFEVYRDTVYKLENEADCINYLESYRCQGGGGTNIQGVLEKTCEDIKNLKVGPFKLEAVEGNSNIVIVNDGQDEVNPNYFPTITTHAFILGCDSKDLRQVCQNSNGTYHRFL